MKTYKMGVSAVVALVVMAFAVRAIAGCFENCSGLGHINACDPTSPCVSGNNCTRTDLQAGYASGSCTGGGGSEDHCSTGTWTVTATVYLGLCTSTCGCLYVTPGVAGSYYGTLCYEDTACGG